MKLKIFPTPQALGLQAAKMVVRLSAQAVAKRGRFTVALSGGSLIKLLGDPLVSESLRSQVDWSAWHVFWADERCVPLDHADSNYRLARQYIFDQAPIPSTQIYPINDTLKTKAAAQDYEATMRRLFKTESWPRFDLILLGMGEDGHTASLFPGHPLLAETQRWVAPIFDSPKPPPERITLTLPLLNSAQVVAFVAAGAGKVDVLPQVVGPSPAEPLLPAARVQPIDGTLYWFVDEAAAAALSHA